MPLFRTPFDNTYRPAYRQVSRVVKGADLLFTCGQLDTDGAGQVQHPGDITAQTIRSMTLLFDALRQAAQCVRRVIRSKLDYGLMIFADSVTTQTFFMSDLIRKS